MFTIHKTNSPHYTWANSCDGWRLLDSDTLTVIQERMPPGTEEVKHFHEKAQQFFFVLTGTLTFYFEDEKVIVQAQEGISILPGKIHQVKNESDVDAEFLVISQPSTKNDRRET